MPTQWKRYRCCECTRILVAWKLRKNNGKRYCSNCIDMLHDFTLKYYQQPPIKADIIAKSTLVNIKKNSKQYNQTGK